MFHRVSLIGNLGRRPEMRYTTSGAAVTSFSVAVNNSYTNKEGEKITETIWVIVSAWNRLAEVCDQYLDKGSKVYVEGKLRADPETGGPRVYEGKNGPGASFEITASLVQFLSSRGDTPQADPVEEAVANF